MISIYLSTRGAQALARSGSFFGSFYKDKCCNGSKEAMDELDLKYTIGSMYALGGKDVMNALRSTNKH